MVRTRSVVRPSALLTAWRALGAAVLMGAWLHDGSGSRELIAVLTLCFLSVTHWRFPRLPVASVLVDQAVCAIAVAFWPGSALGMATPILDAAARGVVWPVIPALAILTALDAWNLPVAVSLLVAGAAGLSIHHWTATVASAVAESDAERSRRYELETMSDHLVSAGIQSARLAEVTERPRIARELHDHAGHELTAAQLALRAFATLAEQGDQNSRDLLTETERRLSDAMGVLRATTRGLAGGSVCGIDALENVCRRFAGGGVDLTVRGNTERIPYHVWSVLEPCLKEALSNASHHGTGGSIAVALDVGPRIARLSVASGSEEPGPRARSEPSPGSTGPEAGIGLRSLRYRARAIGGSVSFEGGSGCRLVCVLPLEEPPDVCRKEETREGPHR